MQKLELIIELRSPVLFAKQSGDSTMTNTLTFIPGSSLLGLLASRYLKGGGEREEFERMFLHGAIVFRNLYPYVDKVKYMPAKRHILQDKQSESKFINIYASDESSADHKVPPGYAYLYGRNCELYQAKTEISFHHERDYKTGISKDAKIFSYEALSNGQLFFGEILGKKEDIDKIEELLAEDKVLRLGKSKTAQYGNCYLYQIENIPYTEKEIEDDDEYVMTLISDSIIKNKYGTSVLEVEEMQSYLGVEIKHFAIDKSKVETVVNAYRCKTPADIAFAAGSSFLITELPKNYLAMQKYGIGDRRHEGYGQVVFENIEEKEYYKPDKSTHERQSSSKPKIEMPDVLKSIVYDLVIDFMTKKYAEEARKLVRQISDNKRNLPSKSLIGRLEAFAKTGDFSTNFKMLRKKAIEELQKIYFDNSDLYSYLENIQKNVENLRENFENNLVGAKKLSNLIDEIDKDALQSCDFVSIYLHYLFNHMRKSMKNEGGE